jgi:hypothetical protein
VPWQLPNQSCRSWLTFSRNSGVRKSGSRFLPDRSPDTRHARLALSTHILGRRSRASGGCSKAGRLFAASLAPHPNPVVPDQGNGESPPVNPLPTLLRLSSSPGSQSSKHASHEDTIHSHLCIQKYVYESSDPRRRDSILPRACRAYAHRFHPGARANCLNLKPHGVMATDSPILTHPLKNNSLSLQSIRFLKNSSRNTNANTAPAPAISFGLAF